MLFVPTATVETSSGPSPDACLPSGDSGDVPGREPGVFVWRIFAGLHRIMGTLLSTIHPPSERGCSRKPISSVLHRLASESRKARSLVHQRPVSDSYMVWCCIDMRDRQCS